MKVTDVMAKPPAYCSPQTNFAVAVGNPVATKLRDFPIVDSKRKGRGPDHGTRHLCCLRYTVQGDERNYSERGSFRQSHRMQTGR